MSADSTYSIELKDETSGAAESAANALVKLKKKIDDDTKALSAMQAAMRKMKGTSSENAAATKALSDQIAAQKEKIGAAQAAFVSLGGTFDGTLKPATRDATGGLKSMWATMRALPAPVAAAIGIVLGFAAATIAATVALLRYGLAQADARRSELLRLEGLTLLRNRFGVAAGSAAEMQGAIDRAAASTALGREQISGMSEGLYRAGLRGAAFSDTLQALSVVEAALGEAGARRFRGRLIMDARAGRSAQALARIQGRFGALAHRQMLSLGVQTRKLHESFSAIFAGLRIERFLEALHSVTQLFSQNTASGRALKTIVETLFQPMIDALASSGPIARRFFQGMVIGALLATIGIQRLSRWMSETFGDSSLLGDVNMLKVALYGGIAVFFALAGAVVLTAGAFALLATTLAIVSAPLLAVPAAIGAVIVAGVALVQWFQSQDWAGIGRSLVDGLVNGIRNAAGRVTQAVRGLAGEARQALTSALGIASPSRVFAALGQQVPRGFAQGVQRTSSIAVGAVDSMAQDATPSSAGRSSTAVSIGDVHIVVQGGGDAREIATSIRDELARALEGLAVTIGAPA